MSIGKLTCTVIVIWRSVVYCVIVCSCYFSIRGTIDGYVRGFDKHFNLLLTDVDERYTPPTPVRIPGPAARHSSLHKDRHPRNDEDTLVRLEHTLYNRIEPV
jgi:small nuclear ribonucleoprotein (snRNP)-like protein